MKLSVVIIAKDVENNIADALETVSFADEIIVIDNESKDRTIDVSEKFGAKVFVHTAQDFSELRNFGLKKAKGEWVLYIDTDERVSSELARNIKYQISNIKYQNIAGYKVQRKNFYYGNHAWPHVEEMERLFLKNKLKYWQGKLHETPIVDGKIDQLEGFLFHYTHRELTSMLEKTIEWSKIEAELRFKAGHPKMTWWRFPRIMFSAFLNSYIKQGGWKVGTIGLIESIYQAFSAFITYGRLWEMQQKK